MATFHPNAQYSSSDEQSHGMNPPQPSTSDAVRNKVLELVGNGDVAALLSIIELLAGERDALDNKAKTLSGEVCALTTKTEMLEAEHERQELRIKQLLFLIYGRKTERLSAEQVHQLALVFGASEQEAQEQEPEVPHPAPPDAGTQEAATNEGATDAEQGKGKKRRKRGPGTVVGAEVERVVKDVPASAEERLCACCHREMKVIDHVDHTTLDFIPAKFVASVERREKLACRHSDCRGDIHTAERSGESPERRKVGASVLAQLVDGKCNDALPVDRQRDQFERLGVSFPLNTLYSLWTYVTTLLLPVAKVTCAQVLADPIVGLDDTKLRVLDKRRPSGSYKGCLWCFTGTRSLVAYAFTETWEAEAIAPFIAAIDGFIQCDDYKGYSSKVEMPGGGKRVLVDPSRRLGCMMHVRRRFREALKLGDKRAARAIDLIGKIYDIEAEAKAQGLDPGARLALRTKDSVPLLDDFDVWVDSMKPKCTPTSLLASALGYAAQQRPYIRRCFTDGRFEIDNGHTERTIRRPCIGRNNYMFTGSVAAAQRLAGAYTLVQSCRNLGIPVRDYLMDVIAKLEAGWPLRRIGELVPDNWARLHGPLAAQQQAAQ